jgi:hypothetical protein
VGRAGGARGLEGAAGTVAHESAGSTTRYGQAAGEGATEPPRAAPTATEALSSAAVRPPAAGAESAWQPGREQGAACAPGVRGQAHESEGQHDWCSGQPADASAEAREQAKPKPGKLCQSIIETTTIVASAFLRFISAPGPENDVVIG